MFKEIFFSLFLCAVLSAESNNENATEPMDISTTTTTTILTTTMSEQKVEAFVNKELNRSIALPPPSIVNLAKQSNKLLDSQNMSENGLVISKPINGCGANCGGLSLTLVVVLVCVISAIIGVILTALFVMRRRFSIWRLNGGKSSSGGDLEGGVEPVEGKTVEINEKQEVLAGEEEKAKETSSSCLTTVENKQAVLNGVTVNVDNGHSNEAVELNKQELAGQSEESKQQQASPSSSSPLIDNNDESSKLISEMQLNSENGPCEPSVTTTSSSSLIVNVLNELSESVALKLASKSPSASKLAPSNTATNKSDPEKQPLNNE